MNYSKKAFSFVEIIIVVAIVIMLSLIAIKVKGDISIKTLNTTSISYIETLETSLTQYKEETKLFPNPLGNISYYGTGSQYVHVDEADKDDASISFGKHGFVTDNVLPKKYLNYLPLDPVTNQFYAYGKTTDNQYYEVAGVINIDGNNTVKLTGNYPGETGPYNLIREYNGPNFVYQGSTTALPYNPDERILTAKIDSYSGTVSITTGGTTLTGNSVLEHTLVEGNKITVATGGEAILYYSDGSQSALGDSSNESILEFARMEFKGEDNLTTRIQLALSKGTLWTKASSLGDQSEFEVYTQDTAASVRGTIFGVQAESSTQTNVTVIAGAVAIKEIPTATFPTINTIIDAIQEETIQPELTSITAGGNISTISGTSETGIEITTAGTNKSYNTDGGTSEIIEPTSLSEPDTITEPLFIDEILIDTASVDTASIQVDLSSNSELATHVLIDNGQQQFLAATEYADSTTDILTISGTTDITAFTIDVEGTISATGVDYTSITESGSSTEFSSALDDISDEASIKFYICKYRGKSLKCASKKEVHLTEGKITKTKIDSVLDPDIKEVPVEELSYIETSSVPTLEAREAPQNCLIDGSIIADGEISSTPFYSEATSGIHKRCEDDLQLALSCEAGVVYSGTEEYTAHAYTLCNNTPRCEYDGSHYAVNNYFGDAYINADGYSIEKNKCIENGTGTEITAITIDCESGYTYDPVGQSCSETPPVYANCSGGDKTLGDYSYVVDAISHSGSVEITSIEKGFDSYENISNTLLKSQKATFSCNDGVISSDIIVGSESSYCKDNTYSKFNLNGTTYCEPKLEGKELYAFAPYDTAGDIELYMIDGTIATKDNGIYMISMNCSGLSGGNCTTSNFTNAGCTSYNKNNSFCSYGSSTSDVKGIYVDNSGEPDFIKYSDLNLGNDFVIEMSVRGDDLKRTDGNYYMFTVNPDTKYTSSKKETKVRINSTYPTMVDLIRYDSSDTITTDRLSKPSLSNNTFYPITTIYNNADWKIKLNGNSKDVEGTVYSINGQNLLIGSNYNSKYTSQWNGIINYVKIYK